MINTPLFCYMKDLMQKYLQGQATEQERTELLARIRSDKQIDAWLRADMEYSDSQMPRPMQDRILRNIVGQRREPAIHSMRPYYWIAACISLFVMVCGLCSILFMQNYAANDMLCADVVVSTQMGEQSHITLPDGSQVTLNALSTIRYATAMPDGKRRVQVDGEAFFNVAKDPEHPFVVTAGDVDITCLGTSFDVRNYADEQTTAVVLADGKVRVSTAEADLTMEPDSRVVYNRSTKTLSKRSVPSSDYICWMSGEVRYNNQTLEQIAAELSRNYNIEVVITSDELKQERFTGYLGRSSLRNILDVICLASDLNYHVDGDTKVYVYPRKKQ